MYEEPVLKDGVIIVRLWWEQVRADEVAIRARVTVDDALTGSTSAASTVDGIVNAVRAAVERFQAGRPAPGRRHSKSVSIPALSTPPRQSSP